MKMELEAVVCEYILRYASYAHLEANGLGVGEKKWMVLGVGRKKFYPVGENSYFCR